MKYNYSKNTLLLLTLIFLSSCGLLNKKSDHTAESKQKIIEQQTNSIPKTVAIAPALPIPTPPKKQQQHTVIVNNVPVHDLLFSLARDSKLNLDIDENVTGSVTLNAIDQPLNAILERIVETNDLTYEIKRNVLRIKKDTPYLKSYRIDYINMSRSSTSNASVSTQIASTGQGAGANNTTTSGNNSSTEVKNSSTHAFWDSLKKNINAIISDSTENENNTNIIINQESGIIAIKATRKQHKEVDAFINEVLFSTQRQVLIEATIAEVSLSDQYQAGIDWNYLSNRLNSATSATQALTDISLSATPSFTIMHSSVNSSGDTIQSTLSALQTFGDVSIMSSPKVMALNNQTALLKVVDNLVYFTVDVNVEVGDENANNFVTFDTEIQTVPVGFVMSVTPFVSNEGTVTLNVRPTISRVIGQARDPNPSLADVGVVNEIPIIQVREVESVLKVNDGDIAVMGGLMQDETTTSNQGVPFISSIPIAGSLFKYEKNTKNKTELVIFIRPKIIKRTSTIADIEKIKNHLTNTHK